MGRKGVVVEIAPKNQVIIMTAQGEFVKVPFKKHVHVGQEIRCAPKRERLSAWQLGLAATLFLTLLGTWPMFTSRLLPASVMPAFVITLDINPSIELSISDKQRVLGIEGLNRDGRDFVSRLAVVGDDLRVALEKITNLAEKDGYLKQGQNQVIVTIASKQDQDATLMELKSRRSGQHSEIERVVVEAFGATQLAQVRVWQVPLALQQEAKLAGITPSRYIAIQMPTQPVIPQRLETKLTMTEPLEVEEQPLSLALSSTLQDQTNVTPIRPVLPPAQWTKRASTVARASEVYNVSFPVVTQAKGEFRLYQ